MNVISNKVTREEREIVPHHLLDVLDQHQEYTVQDFRNQALPIVSFLFVQILDKFLIRFLSKFFIFVFASLCLFL